MKHPATAPFRRPLGLSLGLSLVWVVIAGLVACAPVGGDRYTRKQAQKSLKKLETPGIVIGEFRLTKVVDGDTVWVDGLEASLRLVGIDAEETFKSEGDRRAVETSWDQYLKDKKGTSKRPIKAASPMGEVAKDWGKKWFEGVDKVRVERDHAGEIRDRYNRYLAYVVAPKNGVWLNYNVELVRAGMSPYFPKYGFSRRFHNEFVAAQDEAKNAKRGIWQPGVKSYPDYAEREAWWMARGAFMESFRNTGKDQANYIDLTHFDAMQRLEEHLDKEVHVIGTVSEIRYGERGPTRVTLTHRINNDFPLIFFDKDLLVASGIGEWKSEFVVVSGVPTFYTNKNNNKKQLQIVIDRASQIKLSPVPGLTVPTLPPPAPTGP